MTTYDLFSAKRIYKNKLVIGSNGLKFLDYDDIGNQNNVLYILFDDITSIDNCITTYVNNTHFGFNIKAKQMDNVNDTYKEYNINIPTKQKVDEAYKLILDGFNKSCKNKDTRIGI